jgi:peptidoglycan/LPS O-acetylase OafA/YrhL
VAEQLSVFAPPAFLFVSGVFAAFAAGRSGVGFGWDKAVSRIRMLAIPYVVWSVAIFVMRAAEGSIDRPTGYLAKLIFGGAAEPYYYVPLVVQFYLLAPVLVPMLKKHWMPLLLIAGGIQVAVQVARYPVMLGWDVPAAAWVAEPIHRWTVPLMAVWFPAGIAAGFHWPALTGWLARWRPILPWATVTFALLGVIEWELLRHASGSQWLPPRPTLVDSLYSGSAILTFLAFSQMDIPARDQLDWLGERSYGVYLMHAPALEILARGSYHAVPALIGHAWLFQLLLVTFGLAAPLLFMALVNRSPARPAYNYLFG